MKPDIIVTDIEIADVNFKAEIKFDFVPAYGENDAEVDVLEINVGKFTEFSLIPLYQTDIQFKHRINQLVLDVIYDRNHDSGTELIGTN